MTRLPFLHSATLLSFCLALVACGSGTPTPATPSYGSRLEIEQAAERGDPNAQFELGALYYGGDLGMPKDPAKAREWFEKAADKGEVRAQFNLGVIYYMGEGVKQDYASAREWFEKAAEKGNARAQFNLGVIYYRGEGVAQDFGKARELFTLAANQHFHEAQFNLGVMNAKAEGVPQDIAMAYAWFVAAKENGNPGAPDAIKNIERSLDERELAIVQAAAEELKAKLKATAEEE